MAHTKKSRRSAQRGTHTMRWLWGAVAGVVLLIIAALALGSRENDAPSQKAFDPNFEPDVTGAPRVEVVESDMLDYGEVKLGTTVNTVYTVRNVGDQPLEVLGEPQVELVEGC